LSKLKCPFPFKTDWNLLLKFNATGDTGLSSSKSCYVVRNTAFVNQLREFIFGRRVSQLVHPVLDQNRSLLGVRLVIRGKGGGCRKWGCDIYSNLKRYGINWKHRRRFCRRTLGDDTKSHQLREELKTKQKTFISQLRNKRRRVKIKDLLEVEHNEGIKKAQEGL
jgi:hypothetical protein